MRLPRLSTSKLQDLTQDQMVQLLHKLYDHAQGGGLPGLASAPDLAQSYCTDDRTPQDAARALVRWQASKAGLLGAATSVGGLLTLPVSLPANITGALYVQLRLVAAIAHLGGYDLRDDRARTLVLACLAGKRAQRVLRQAGVTVGRKLWVQGVKRVPYAALKQVNRAVGFRLVTKFGKTGVVNLGKLAPVAGCVFGGAVDGASTYGVGQAARRTLLPPA